LQLERECGEASWRRGGVVLAFGGLGPLGRLNGVPRRVQPPMASQRMELRLQSCGPLPRCAASGVRGLLHVCPPPAIGAGACRGLPSRRVRTPRRTQPTRRVQTAVFKPAGRHVGARIDRHAFQRRRRGDGDGGGAGNKRCSASFGRLMPGLVRGGDR